MKSYEYIKCFSLLQQKRENSTWGCHCCCKNIHYCLGYFCKRSLQPYWEASLALATYQVGRSHVISRLAFTPHLSNKGNPWSTISIGCNTVFSSAPASYQDICTDQNARNWTVAILCMQSHTRLCHPHCIHLTKAPQNFFRLKETNFYVQGGGAPLQNRLLLFCISERCSPP